MNIAIIKHFRNILERQKVRNEKRKLKYVTDMSKDVFYYDDIDGVPYICSNSVPLYRVSSEPTDMVKGVVNIQDTCKVLLNHRNAFIKTKEHIIFSIAILLCGT